MTEADEAYARQQSLVMTLESSIKDYERKIKFYQDRRTEAIEAMRLIMDDPQMVVKLDKVLAASTTKFPPA